MKHNTMTLVFYAGLLYGEYTYEGFPHFKNLSGLPDGAYIRFPKLVWDNQWYAADFTPVLLEDIPKVYLLLALIL